MKYCLFFSALVLISCTGTLSDNQRKKIKEEMTNSEIKKVTESEITEAAFKYGRKLASIIEESDKALTNKPFLDSLAIAYNVEIVTLQSSSNENLRNVEKLLLEAYQTNAQSSDNIQKMGNDTIIYTKPLMREHPDGSTEFLKALGIRMLKKQIILSSK